MNYIDKLKLKAFLYRLNCGLRFNMAINVTNYKDLTADDMYANRIRDWPKVGIPLEDFDLILCDNLMSTRVFGKTVVTVNYNNNQLIIEEKIYGK